MWDLNYKESWVPKNWCFWTVVLKKTLENPLDCKEIQPVNPKGNESWIFIGRTDAEAETPILWAPDVKNWLIWKDPDAGKDWRQEEKGSTEMVEWDHWLDGHEFEQVLGAGDGQGSLACCRTWGRKVRHDCVTELKWTTVKVDEDTPCHLLYIHESLTKECTFPYSFSCDLCYSEKNEAVQFCGLLGTVALLWYLTS